MKKINIKEVRELFNTEAVYETQDSFVLKRKNKYASSITFVMDKHMHLSAWGGIVNPLDFSNKNINMLKFDFQGNPEYLFGRFWASNKHGNCFRVTEPKEAEHILVRVEWGSRFGFGSSEEEAKKQAKKKLVFFQRTKSNGGRTGFDYWVISLWDKSSPLKGAEEFVSKCNRDLIAEREQNEATWTQKLKNREHSREQKSVLMPRLLAVQGKLNSMGMRPLLFEEYSYTDQGISYLYTDKNVTETEERIQEKEDAYQQECLANQQADADRCMYEPLIRENLWTIKQSGYWFGECNHFWGHKAWTILVRYPGHPDKKFTMDKAGYEQFMEFVRPLDEKLKERREKEAAARTAVSQS